jgi:adenosylcobyric acid synthase
MAAAIERHAAAGGAVLGICGGLQMLGEALVDPQGVDAGEPATLPGLELLPLVTHFEPPKLLRCTRARFGAVGGAWAALSGVGFDGYEIRHGRSSGAADVALHNAEGEPIGWQRGSVLGLYAHGLFESDAALHALFGASVRTLDSVFDGLADFIDARFEPGSLLRLIARQGPSR